MLHYWSGMAAAARELAVELVVQMCAAMVGGALSPDNDGSTADPGIDERRSGDSSVLPNGPTRGRNCGSFVQVAS